MIEVRGLEKRFGGVTALDGVSFDVQPGETFALLGPNGSGKTTTLKCLSGLVIPSVGQIRINGIDIAGNPVASRAAISTGKVKTLLISAASMNRMRRVPIQANFLVTLTALCRAARRCCAR